MYFSRDWSARLCMRLLQHDARFNCFFSLSLLLVVTIIISLPSISAIRNVTSGAIRRVYNLYCIDHFVLIKQWNDILCRYREKHNSRWNHSRLLTTAIIVPPGCAHSARSIHGSVYVNTTVMSFFYISCSFSMWMESFSPGCGPNIMHGACREEICFICVWNRISYNERFCCWNSLSFSLENLFFSNLWWRLLNIPSAESC
jgi:hypothetical protein